MIIYKLLSDNNLSSKNNSYRLMRFFLISIIFLITLMSCKTNQNKLLDEGKIKRGVYYNKEIGWTMKIPEGWSINPKQDLEERSKKAKHLIKESTETNADISKLKRLLSIQKNSNHIFESSIETYKFDSKEKWKDNINRNRKIIYDSYKFYGIKIDTSSSIEVIDNLEFDVFHIELEGLNKQNQKSYLDLYVKYLNGFEFIVGLNYLNEKEKNEIKEAWKNSKFKFNNSK